ncbi:MAG: hypothetical protein FJ104_09590 [Deltaproteobacteria bacterium]|nr:hypothetical protein [Deltaproteobacteria bacterium]
MPPGDGGSAAGGSTEPPDPLPAAPCGDDLDVVTGRVVPDLGVLPAPAPFTGDPAEDGPEPFTAQVLSVPLVAETYVALGLSIQIAAGALPGAGHVPNGAGPYPLVIVLPGFGATQSSYAPYAAHLASHGFVVVSIDTRTNTLFAEHDREAVEVVRTIDWALEGSPFAAKIDRTKVAAMGHSKGGKVAFFAGALDARIDLIVGWDPVNSGGGPCAFDANCNRLPVAPNCPADQSGAQYLSRAETLVIGAPPDAAFNPDPHHNAVHFYRGASSPASLVLLRAAHADWAFGASQAAVFRLTKAVHTARLLSRMKARTGLEAYLPEGPTLKADPLVLEARAK